MSSASVKLPEWLSEDPSEELSEELSEPGGANLPAGLQRGSSWFAQRAKIIEHRQIAHSRTRKSRRVLGGGPKVAPLSLGGFFGRKCFREKFSPHATGT